MSVRVTLLRLFSYWLDQAMQTSDRRRANKSHPLLGQSSAAQTREITLADERNNNSRRELLKPESSQIEVIADNRVWSVSIRSETTSVWSRRIERRSVRQELTTFGCVLARFLKFPGDTCRRWILSSSWRGRWRASSEPNHLLTPRSWTKIIFSLLTSLEYPVW